MQPSRRGQTVEAVDRRRRCLHRRGFEPVDACRRHAVAQPVAQGAELLRRALQRRLYGPVHAVAHPAGHAERLRATYASVPPANASDASAKTRWTGNWAPGCGPSSCPNLRPAGHRDRVPARQQAITFACRRGSPPVYSALRMNVKLPRRTSGLTRHGVRGKASDDEPRGLHDRPPQGARTGCGGARGRFLERLHLPVPARPGGRLPAVVRRQPSRRATDHRRALPRLQRHRSPGTARPNSSN